MNAYFSIAIVVAWAGATLGGEAQTVLSLQLEGCPAGAVLEWPDTPEARRAAGPPNAAVDRFFCGWVAPLGGWMFTPSCLKVVHEDGQALLASCRYGANGYQSRALIGGRMSWQDYRVEAEVRLLGREPVEAFGEPTRVPLVAVVARYQDLNRYYAWALRPEGPALYRRENSRYVKLAEARVEVAPARFYTLRLEARGDQLEGFLDGRRLVAVRDAEYTDGKVGVRFNADVRVRSIRVNMDEEAIGRSRQREAQQQRELADVRARYARPKIHKRLEASSFLPGAGGVTCYPAHLVSGRGWHLVVQGAGKMAAVDLDGRVLWQAPVALVNPAFGEPDAEGVSRIVGLVGKKLVMLDGRTGRRMAEADAPPPPLIYTPWRLANLTGKGQIHYAARTGNNSPEVIVYGGRLEVLFRHKVSIEIGHTFGLGFWDVDGDGREELLAGGSCLRGDGRPAWESRVTETHLDQVLLGPLGPRGEAVAVFLGVDEGVFFLDGHTGRRLACVDVGHSQGVVAGNFRGERPGLEVLTFDRWGAFGVTALFTGSGERLKQWMLVPEEYYMLHAPVAWRGDGSELILVSRKFAAPTLYDGDGNELFQLPVEPGYYTPYTHLFPLDAVGDSREEILAVERTGRITLFTQDAPPPKDVKLAPAPVKWMLMSVPKAAFSPRQPNLLANGGFEQLDEGGGPAGWKPAGKASVVAETLAGKHAARVRFTDGMSQQFTVKPEQEYEILGFARQEKPGVEPGRLKIIFKDAKGREVGAEAFRLFDLSPVEYRPFRFEMTAPEGAAVCSFAILGRFTGSEWILYDELCVRAR